MDIFDGFGIFLAVLYGYFQLVLGFFQLDFELLSWISWSINMILNFYHELTCKLSWWYDIITIIMLINYHHDHPHNCHLTCNVVGYPVRCSHPEAGRRTSPTFLSKINYHSYHCNKNKHSLKTPLFMDIYHCYNFHYQTPSCALSETANKIT